MFVLAITYFGFKSFCCLSITDFVQPDPNSLDIVEFPKRWTERYVEKKYFESDIVLKKIGHSTTPEDWSEYEDISPEQVKILDEASQFGLVHGVSIPIYVPGVLPTIVSISGENKDVDPISYPILYVLAMYFHEAILRVKGYKNYNEYADLKLTQREKECLRWVAAGKSDSVIGDILQISRHTVHYHIENVKRKFDLPTRMQAVVRAISTGKIHP